MDRVKKIKILAVIIQAGGILGMLGWAFDISAIKSVSPHYVTMKFSTALSFLMSGLILYFIADIIGGKKAYAQAFMPAAVLIILLFMTTLLASSVLRMRTGVEDLLIPEAAGAVRTVTPGRPSIATMADFILAASAGMAALFSPGWLSLWLRITGTVISVTGDLAVTGYLFNLPLLYYEVKGFSTAMAVHTAVLFVLLGAGLVLSAKALAGER